MEPITAAMLAEAINDVRNGDGLFDSHAVQQRLLRLHPVAFAEGLLRYRNNEDPLHAFSAQLAKFIDRSFPGQIRQTEKVDSLNLGGLPGKNQQWVKLVRLVEASGGGADRLEG